MATERGEAPGVPAVVAQETVFTTPPQLPREWVQPGAWGPMTALLTINWLEVRASEARLGKRIDELRAESLLPFPRWLAFLPDYHHLAWPDVHPGPLHHSPGYTC